MGDHDDSREVFRISDHERAHAHAAGMPRIKKIVYEPDKGVTTYTFVFDPGPDGGELEHLEEQGPFAITRPDGQTESFADSPTRYPAIARDPAIGRFAPMMRRRRPVLPGLCREERGAP